MLYRRCLRRAHWTVPVVALLACARVLASPDADPVSQFLSEKGLVAAPAATAAPAEEKRGLMAHVRDTTSEMVMTAMNFLGVPYRRGGDSAEEGFDCSGFTRYIFERSLGLVLPRRADEQAKAPGLIKISKNDLKPGDLVFFNTLRATFSHVGIYIGEGKFIHSPRSGSEVRIEDMRISYWTKRFTGARRAGSLDASGTTDGSDSVRTGGGAASPSATSSPSGYPDLHQH